jgi:hypothetical protein
VVVRKGLYRESVVVPRGGTGADRLISYEAEPGVVVRGSKVLEGWSEVPESRNVWKASIADLASEDENPFLLRGTPDDKRYRQQTVRGSYPYRGMLFQDGRPLEDVNGTGEDYSPEEFQDKQRRLGPGQFLVDRDKKEVYVAFDRDQSPGDVVMEATFCSSLFGPRQTGIGFIRVKGFTFEQASSSVGFPQQGAVTTWCGHHWIIEDNTVRHAFGMGVDCGIREEWITLPPVVGYHIVRRNLFAHCGQAGIISTGSGNRLNNHTNYDFHWIIEDNVILRCGNGPRIFGGLYEAAGIKVHMMRHSLLRGNRIFDQGVGVGLWTDFMFFDNRITENVVWLPEGNILTTLFVESQPPARNVYANNILFAQYMGIKMSHNNYLHNLIRVGGGVPIGSTGFGGRGWKDVTVKSNLIDDEWARVEASAKKCGAKEAAQNFEQCFTVTANESDMTLTIELTKPIESYPVEEFCPLDFHGRPRSAAGTMPGPFDKLEVGKPVTVQFFPEWLRQDAGRLAQAREALEQKQ